MKHICALMEYDRRNKPDLSSLEEIITSFQIPGQISMITPVKTGHINDTYAVSFSWDRKITRYILQRINPFVFPQIDKVMENIVRVTSHLREKLCNIPGADPEREALTVIPTRNNAPFLKTPGGESWRVYPYIENAKTFNVAESDQMVFEAARALGRFQFLLSDLPDPPLNETIIDFHHTPRRVEAMERAVCEDAHGRRSRCQKEIDFVLSLKSHSDTVIKALKNGESALRVTHNDTKINNVMFDEKTGKGLCIIDLDTVMPGSILYDFGDMMRTSVGHFRENERDLGRVFFDLERFKNLVRGYLESARSIILDKEIELLVFSGLLITYEIGIRFLTDFLEGDVYFRISRPEENLDRARTQFTLVKNIEAQKKELEAIVEKECSQNSL